VEKNNFHLTIG